jgi:hypothetical protein
MMKGIQSLIFFLCFLFSIKAFCETDSCSTLADLTTSSNKNLFVGFGAGETQKQADNNANIDLASRIRQQVSSTSTVTQDNNKATFDSSAKSSVSESLVGAKILKRCSNSNSFSTVVTLDKKLFLDMLKTNLQNNIEKAQGLINSINKNSDEIIAKNIEIAKKFISDYQANFENDLKLCKVYDGCQDIKNQTIFADLAEVVAKNGDKDQYLMVANDDLATQSLKNDLITLAQKEGLNVIEHPVSSNSDSSTTLRKLFAKCKINKGTKIFANSSDKVLTVECSLEGFSGKQKMFGKLYSCKAMVDDNSEDIDAVNSCSGRLTSNSQ